MYLTKILEFFFFLRIRKKYIFTHIVLISDYSSSET